jgi:hypothetical protein
VNCEVVFLNKNEPDLEFEGLLKREKTRVAYFQARTFSLKVSGDFTPWLFHKKHI